MNSVQDTFKHNRQRKNVILGGAMILVCITVLSCVSSFVIYRGGFTDVPHPFDKLLALFAVIVVEGAFVWLVYGFTRAFSSAMERFISICGMGFLLAVMLMNLVTHFMMVKGIELDSFQLAWIQWGAVMVFIAVLMIVLFITLADPVIMLIRLELRYLGKQQEKILEAKTEGLESNRVREAMSARAEHEADLLATKIIREGRSLPAIGVSASHRSHIGFATEPDDEMEDDYKRPKGRRR
jgi:hypothetical protein